MKKPNFKQYMKLFKIIFFTLTSTVNVSRPKTATVNVKETKHSPKHQPIFFHYTLLIESYVKNWLNRRFFP